MTYLMAILLPPVALAMVGKPVQALLSLILMVTLIGWPVAAIWAVLVVNGAHADKRTKRLEEAIREHGPVASGDVALSETADNG